MVRRLLERGAGDQQAQWVVRSLQSMLYESRF